MTAIAKPFQEQTYYELLEVSPHASMDEIRAAYHRAIELYSPDSVAIYALENPTLAEELRAKLQEAMEILTDEDLRPEYDRTIGLAPRPGPADIPGEAEEEEDDEEAADAGKAAIASVMPPPEAVDSTHRELKVSYVDEKPEAVAPPPPAAEAQAEPKPAPRPPKEAAPVAAPQSAVVAAEAAAPRAEAPRPKTVEITPDAEFSGELLRHAREAKGLSIQQLAERTRISSRHLENIEADRYKELPATVYLRGMLMSLAREIGQDPLRVAKSYLALVARGGRAP